MSLNECTKESGVIQWKIPSNIALVKYWGKLGHQIPANPSLSLTLKNAHTITKLSYQLKNHTSTNFEINFLFEGELAPSFEKKIIDFLNQNSDYFLPLKNYSLKLESHNSFPHSTGIASSASGSAAFVTCFVSLVEMIETHKFGQINLASSFWNKCSHYSRLASGSASRSLFAKMSNWGEVTGLIENSSNLYANQFSNYDQRFNQLQDAILICDQDPKKTSSRAGHNQMSSHPYKEVRYKNASDNFEKLIHSLKDFDLETFSYVCEYEAMSLHAMMMLSNPSFILMRPNTINVLERINQFKATSKTFLTFTLDAGPNVHLIYFSKDKDIVQSFIQSELEPFLVGPKIIWDELGDGPELL